MIRNTGAAFGGRPIGSVFLIILYHIINIYGYSLYIPYIFHIYIYIYTYITICQRPFNSATWLFIAPVAAAVSSAAPGNFRPGPPEHTATPERPCTRRAGVGQERRPIPYKSFQKINANRPGRQAENAVPNRPCRRLAILRLGTGCRVKKKRFRICSTPVCYV